MSSPASRTRTPQSQLAAVLLALAAFSFLAAHLRAHPRQSQQPAASTIQSQRPIRTTTRLVQLSVIASDKNGAPVADLTASDFTVLDNGHPVKIEIFRRETAQTPTAALRPLPPDTYSNQLRITSPVPSNITILLLDGLNTPVTDQAYARQQILKFLQNIQPVDRLAVYTLGRELHILQNFTSDSSKLAAALAKYNGQTTLDLDASTPNDLQTGYTSMDALLQDAFQREANIYIQDRVNLTVAALIQIANYAAALPGRKNLLWVSGSFPFSVGYENLDTIARMLNNPQSEVNISGEQLLFAEDIEKAARALNDANIAVYPVDARGLLGIDMKTNKSGANKTTNFSAMNNAAPTTGTGGGGGGRGAGGGGARGAAGGGFGNMRTARTPKQASQGPANPMLNPDNTTFETMDALANDTGGHAFYNTNDISGSLRRAMDDSRVTYEIGYYPADVKWDGSFHNITVQVQKPEVQLRARKGYFAMPEPAPSADMLRDLIATAATSPLDSTGLDLAVRIKPADSGSASKASSDPSASADKPASQEGGADKPATEKIVGGNASASAAKSVALTAMIFFNPHSIQFDSANGHYDASIQIVVAQLDAKNQILTDAEQSLPLSLPQGKYEQFLKQQVALQQPVTVHPNAATLRVILLDAKSAKLGAVTIPLAKYLQP